MEVSILMPALSPTMESGTLAKWMVKEGDEVASGDLIAEIETDKAIMEFEAADDGTIAKILVPEGTQDVAVNTPIALLATEGEESARSAGTDAWPGPGTSCPAAACGGNRSSCNAAGRLGNRRRCSHKETDRSRGIERSNVGRDETRSERLPHGRGGGRIPGRIQDLTRPA